MDDEKTLEEEESEEEAEETVTLTKAEHEKLLNREKEALAKEKEIKELKGKKGTITEEPLTKGDFYRANEKQAIQLATIVSETDSEDSAALKKELSDNWDKIRVFYSGVSGRETVKDIHEDILDAYYVWKRRTGGTVEKVDGKVQEVAHIAGAVGKGPLPKDSIKVIPKPVVGMEHWKTAK